MQWDERRNKNFSKCYGIYYIKTMETYCVSCRKDTSSKNSSVRRSKKID